MSAVATGAVGTRFATASVAKHIDEDRLGKLIEMREDLAALGAKDIGLVEDRGDPALLVERWQWNLKLLAVGRGL